MTKFVKFNKKNGNQVGVVQVKLVNIGETLSLAVVDEDGETKAFGYILNISEDGITLCQGLGDALGLKVTKKEYVKVVKD